MTTIARVLLIIFLFIMCVMMFSCKANINITQRERMIQEHQKFYRFKTTRQDETAVTIGLFVAGSWVANKKNNE